MIGLRICSTVESGRTRLSVWSPKSPPTSTSTIPAISAISSARPQRELSRPSREPDVDQALHGEREDTRGRHGEAKNGESAGAAEDKDVNKAGKVIGYDVLRFFFDPKTNTASVGVALDTKGGFLYGVLRESSGPVTHGKVTGGTGAFTGAAGTITARTNNTGTKTAVTITYHT